MKKICCFIALLAAAMLLFSCGGTEKLDAICAHDYITDQQYSIPMRVSGTIAPNTSFNSDQDIDALAEAIREKDPDVSVQVYQEQYICVQTGDNCFLVILCGETENAPHGKYSYQFLSPLGEFLLKEWYADDMHYTSETYMYLPYHLVSGLDIQNILEHGTVPEYEKAITCEARGTMEEFYAFYSSLSACTVEREADSLIVTCTHSRTKEKTTMTVVFGEDQTVTFSID